jgi:hypothetical protein
MYAADCEKSQSGFDAISWRSAVKVASLLAIVAVCLSEFVFLRQSGVFRDWRVALLSVQTMLLCSLMVWFGVFLFRKR